MAVRKPCFFEKKQQKTLSNWCSGVEASTDGEEQSFFDSFLSTKKKGFCSSDQPCVAILIIPDRAKSLTPGNRTMTDLAPEARWEARYAATSTYLFGTEPNRFLVEAEAHLPRAAKILAVADGEGRNGVFLASRGHQVHAVEYSATAIARAQHLAAAQGVSLHSEQADLLRWTWPVAAYDAVVAIFVQFVPPAARPAFFANMVAALRPGGILLLQGYRPEQIVNGTGGPSDPAHCYTEDLLRAEFADLALLHLHSHDAEIAEGTAHHGPSALIDLIARKP